MGEISSTFVLTGCGNNELVLRNPKWRWSDYKMVIFVTLDDWKSFNEQGLEGFPLEKGEHPIKMTSYAMIHPKMIHRSWYQYYDIDVGDPEILSELYSQYGAFVEIPSLYDEFKSIEEAEKDLKSERMKEYLELVMSKLGIFIDNEKEDFLEKFTREEQDE